jgi:metallophosphoesterase superfamily enzyme
MRVHDEWLLTPQRAAVHLPTATAVVADLHLGYGEARRARGEAVPVPEVAECLAPLALLAASSTTRRLVIAGDLFEDGCNERLTEELLTWAEGVGLELTAVVPGNHDRHPQRLAGRLPLRPEGICLGGWHVVHGDGELPAGTVAHGHVHPCLRWGRRLSTPCYLVTADRLVLPAFSADARGVNVLRDASWGAYRCYPVTEGQVLDLGLVTGIGRALMK